MPQSLEGAVEERIKEKAVETWRKTYKKCERQAQ